MNEPSKTPFEPIPMPGLPAMPAIPDLPAIPEMPRPSFSRTATPPAPVTRRPLMIEDEKPNPFLLPQGIAPEAPHVPLPPAPAPVSGGALSWLKPSRAKGVVFAGLASLGIGAFGLNAIFPTPVHEVPKGGSLADATPPAPAKMHATLPKVIEERPTVEPPALLPREIVAKVDDPWATTTPLRLVEGTTPVTVPTVPPTVPLIPEPTPTTLPVPAPAPLPTVVALPVPAIPGFEEKPPVAVAPPPTLPRPAIKIDTPLELPVPKEITKPMPPVLVAPIEEAKPIPVVPPAVIAPTPPPVTLVPEPKRVDPMPFPLPLPVPAEKPAPVDAKTDYDVDIHKLKAGDTYAIISEKFYGTASYGGALRSYNDGLELARMRDVQVPPMHVIKKFGTGRDATDAPRVLPVGVLEEPRMVAPPGIERDIQWGTPGNRKTDKPADGGVNWR